jgi:phosphocarrier protein
LAPENQPTREDAFVPEATVTITNQTGLHARPAALFVQAAKRFQSKIVVSKDGKEVDAKSIIGIMTLAAKPGAAIVIRAEGEDSEQALEALGDLVRSNFGEE